MKTSDLMVEEALIAGILLHGDDPRVYLEVADEDVFYDHLRPLLKASRQLHALGKPVNAVTVMYALERSLDELSWGGLRGEEMVLDLTSRYTFRLEACSPIAMANIVHNYAERRRALQAAHEEGTRKYRETMTKAGMSPPRGVGTDTWWLKNA